MTILNDPRTYSEIYPKSNKLIYCALQVLDNKATFNELIDIIHSELIKHNDSMINIAINLSPNFAVSKLIWEATVSCMTESFKYFAIPIIFVVDNTQQKRLDEVLNAINYNLLSDLLQKTQIFNNTKTTLVEKIFAYENISQIKLSELTQIIDKDYNLSNKNNSINSMQLKDTAVTCYFLLIHMHADNINSLSMNDAYYNSYSMQLMEFLVQHLKHFELLNCVPIPFAPMQLLQAINKGDHYIQEISLQIGLSSIIRDIRNCGLIATAIIKTFNNEIIIRIIASNPNYTSHFIDTFNWLLKPYDDFNEIFGIITLLLSEMHVEYSYNQ